MDSFLAVVHPDERANVGEAIRSGITSGCGCQLDHRIVRPDGAVRLLNTQCESELDSAGRVEFVAGTVQDVTASRGAAAELAQAKDLIAGVLDAATEQSIIGLDVDGFITVFNAGAERMLGYTAAEMIGQQIPPELHDMAEIAVRAAELGIEPSFRAVVGQAADGKPETRQWTNVAKNGRRLQVLVTATAMRGPNGEITGFIKVGTDITGQVTAERALRSSEALFEGVFDRAPTGMLIADTVGTDTGRLLRVNEAMCRITGLPAATLMGMEVQDLVHPEHRNPQQQDFLSLASGMTTVTDAERRWVHADGRDIWVQASGTIIQNHDHKLVIGMVEDITARKEAEGRLSYLALHDALTGLPNRTLLLDRMAHELAATRRSETHVAVFFIDLDGFKAVNDVAGHLAGDEVLLMVGQRLRDHVRPGDTVARLGGDEFVALCPGFHHDQDTQALAQRILGVLSQPFVLDESTHQLSASIGIAVSGQQEMAEDLLRTADDAMYAAKEAGKNRALQHRPGAEWTTRTARAARHVKIEGELLGALDRGELVMHAQPVLHLPEHDVIAFETLIRWNHPDRGLLAPATFLDVAENSPLMARIGRRVLEESCRIGATLTSPEQEFPAPSIFVNISGRQLERGNLCEDVLRALDMSGLVPTRLVLELTETATPLISGSVVRDIQELRDRGIRLAIDDVGTGYSSLSRFTELPVDILKIDRQFVGRIGQNDAVDAVIAAILNIGRSLELQVVAEGVETFEQEHRLYEAGCTTVQGFLYSKPQPERQLRRLTSATIEMVERH